MSGEGSVWIAPRRVGGGREGDRDRGREKTGGKRARLVMPGLFAVCYRASGRIAKGSKKREKRGGENPV